MIYTFSLFFHNKVKPNSCDLTIIKVLLPDSHFLFWNKFSNFEGVWIWRIYVSVWNSLPEKHFMIFLRLLLTKWLKIYIISILLKANVSKKPAKKSLLQPSFEFPALYSPLARGKIAREIQNSIEVKIFWRVS